MHSDEAQTFERIAALIGASATVAVCGHTDPDGDALGSVLALTAIIEKTWPAVRVQPLLANDRPVPAAFRFLPGAERLLPARAYAQTPDLFIAVDTPVADRLRDAADVLARAGATASVDHHPTRGPLAQVCLVRESAASTGDVVYDFMRHVGCEPTPAIAQCILTAVMTDTGRFQYQNTDAHALRVAAAMVEAGASPALSADNVYQSLSMPALKLRELVLGRLACDPEHLVAYSWVTLADLERTGAVNEDCEGLIDEVRLLEGTEACLFMRERADGTVRGNLRAKSPELNVAAVAETFGGGGHRAASGFTLDGPVDAALARALVPLTAAARAVRASRGEAVREA
jgi:phosphoesterase RecJ-like protein